MRVKKKKKKKKEWYFTPNVAKRAGLVNWVCGLNGLWVKTGQSGRGLSCVELTRIFQTNFLFFFEIDAICQLFINSLIVIRFSLVIL